MVVGSCVVSGCWYSGDCVVIGWLLVLQCILQFSGLVSDMVMEFFV